MAENDQTLFRKKAVARISSPDQLTDYLRVTNPGIWVILASVILLLAGLFAWSMIGTLETKVDVKVIVENNSAQVIALNTETLEAGMPLRVSGQEFWISSAERDEYGRTVGMLEIELTDGSYDGMAITETVHPIDFLFERR